MDVVTLTFAKQYTDCQRLAYTEPATLTWDGDDTGRAKENISADELLTQDIVHIC